MNDNFSLPSVPSAASFLFAAAGFRSVHIYRYAESRWFLQADGEEFMLFDLPEGLKLVDNPF